MKRKLLVLVIVCVAMGTLLRCKREKIPLPPHYKYIKGTAITFVGPHPLKEGWVQVAQNTDIQGPSGLAIDVNDNIYAAHSYKIYRIHQDGKVDHLFGMGSNNFEGDGGPATSANGTASDMTIDTKGNIFFCDFYNYRIRRISVDNKVSTIAGKGSNGEGGDGGQAMLAELGGLENITSDTKDNIFINSIYYQKIRRIDSSGIISTLADISGTSRGICSDNNGNIYVADGTNNYIKKIDPFGSVSIIAGTGTVGFTGDGGPAISAQVDPVGGICIDKNNNIYYIDGTIPRVRRISSDGIISTVAGGGNDFVPPDEKATNALSLSFYGLEDICVDSRGDIYFTDWETERIYKLFMSNKR